MWVVFSSSDVPTAIVLYSMGVDFFFELMLTCWFGLVWGEIVYQSRERGENGDSDGPYVVHVSPGAVHHILFLFSPFLLLAFSPFSIEISG
jgi:hypothetical protein